MAEHDIDALKRAVPLPDLIARYGIELKRAGRELKGLCPFHKERTPSFGVFASNRDASQYRYYCAGCGATGDQVEFIRDMDGLTRGDAIRRLAEIAGGSVVPANDNRQHAHPMPAQATRWQPIPAPDEPAPATLRINRNDEWIEAPVVGAWAFRDRTGQLWGYDCRIEFTRPDGTTAKDIIPITYRVNSETGEARWKQGSLPEPRPLFGAEMLDAHPEAQIILAEGCKKTAAARDVIGGTSVLVLAWQGGCKAVEKTDWSLLAGRKIVGWPDCDSKADRGGRTLPYAEQPGMAAMLRIADLVEQHGGTMRIVAVPAPGTWPDGYDLHDLIVTDGWDRARVLAYLRDNLRTPAEIRAMSDQLEQAAAAEHDEPPPSDEPPPHYGDDDSHRGGYDNEPAGVEPFRIIGFDRGVCYYLPEGFAQVVPLSATAHTKNNLLLLAPLHYWQANFPAEKRSGDKVDWTLATESLIRRAQRAGIYDPEIVRGRGAWWEDGRWAVHLGDRVIIDGVEHDLRMAPTRYVYEAAKPIPMQVDNPLPARESIHLVEICEALRWERPIYGKLLAGFVFLAPVCGALAWRPHIWITGAAGSGKSTVMTDIIGRCLRGLAIETEGETSEAGLRQALRQDALPVVFDEFESERKKAAENVENVLAMVTRASSNSNASLLKGGQDGNATAFKTRAMFCFSSIGVNLKQHAVRTRVTVLSLYSTPETPESLTQYNGMMRRIYDTLSDDYIARLQARAVRLLPVIRHNAKVFAEAAAVVLKDRRMGDQIGTLLAGAFALHSEREATHDFAEEWIRRQSWDEVAEVNEQKDEASCLAYLLSHQLRVDTTKGVKTRSIGELIESVAYIVTDNDISIGEAHDTLRRHGVSVSPAGGSYSVSFAGSHPALERILGDTPWAKSYNRTLKRLPGAEAHPARKYGATTHRGVTIPLSSIA